MPIFRLVLVLLGLLAELPQGLASMDLVGVIHPGSLPGSPATRDLVWVGIALCTCGLYQMAQSKGRQGWVAVLGILGIPGLVVGLVVASRLKSRIASPET